MPWISWVDRLSPLFVWWGMADDWAVLDATGICAVAGSGFGQEPETYHIRLTALCPGVEEYVGKIEQFHKGFMEMWS